jgi:exopolyphosphatase/guanosine-5'-triphosphate,3'-diphosphate pyrophosphatase
VECKATSAIRSLENREMVVHQIKLRTGFDLQVPSNSEMRLLMYKGITIKKEDFDKIIAKNTAILDIGASSLQISLFDKQALSVTQNIQIGTLKTQDMLSRVEQNSLEYFSIVEEYIGYELNTFRSIYLKEKAIKNVIAIGDSSMNWSKVAPELHITDYLTRDQVNEIYKKIRKATTKQIALEYGLSYEVARYLLPSIIIYKNFLDQSKAEMIWLTKTNLCDGMVVDYSEREKKVQPGHDFNKDIVMAAKNFAKRYRYNKAHTAFVTEMALNIFDHTKKYHGLGARERLLLELSCLLHECGKFINMNDPGTNGYQLITSTEFIGLSHRERNLVANVVLYNTSKLPAYDDQNNYGTSDYLLIAKLTAILRLANVLDRSHKQKLTEVSVVRKGNELIITGTPSENMTLEASLLDKKADFFEEIYGIRPVLRQRRGF